MVITGFFLFLAIAGISYEAIHDSPTSSSVNNEYSHNESAGAGEIPAGPVEGMVTMIDLGAKECIPCKMMAPILEELEKDYKGKAAIIFIDVAENPEQARKYGIRGIPTQIFYDEKGREVYRHAGFLDKKAIAGKLEQLGIDRFRI